MSESPAKASILLVDDHALFREGVSRFLEAEAEFVIVGSVGSVQEALSILNTRTVDLILLDYDLGERDGIDFIRQASELGFHGKILLVTAGVELRKATTLLQLGISGIFMKHNSPELLKQAMHEVLLGNVWFEKDYLQRIVQASAQRPPSSDMSLTAREDQVLSFVFDGLANKEIADRLGVSESAVKATMQQLFHKTGVRTRSQLVRAALERLKMHP
jgi:two-component system nitrate/nitrite response regulator NarL